MKKELLFMATAALAISSCTQVEVDEVAATQKEPIQFEQFIGKATRADDVTTATLDRFRVLGKWFKDFEGEEGDIDITVTKSGSGWIYSNTLYWEEGTKYCFTATNHFGDPYSDDFKFIGMQDENYYIQNSRYCTLTTFDLVTAVCPMITGKASGNSAVSFNFKHALAKVQFTFENGYADDTKVLISSPMLEGVSNTASFEHQNGKDFEWQLTSGQSSQEMDDITFAQQGESQTRTTYVLPQNVHSYEVKGHELTFNLSVTGTSIEYEEIRIIIPSDVISKWEAGKAYNYKITIKPATVEPEEVQFTVSIDSWGSADDVDLDNVEISEN